MLESGIRATEMCMNHSPESGEIISTFSQINSARTGWDSVIPLFPHKIMDISVVFVWFFPCSHIKLWTSLWSLCLCVIFPLFPHKIMDISVVSVSLCDFSPVPTQNYGHLRGLCVFVWFFPVPTQNYGHLCGLCVFVWFFPCFHTKLWTSLWSLCLCVIFFPASRHCTDSDTPWIKA